MKLRRHVEIERGLNLIDLTPLIDMVFLLLLFFMLTSSFIIQSGIKINLPKSVTSDNIESKNLIITVTRENVIYVNQVLVTNKELRLILAKAKSENSPVLISADAHANLGRVVEVWDLARELGISQVNIATNVK